MAERDDKAGSPPDAKPATKPARRDSPLLPDRASEDEAERWGDGAGSKSDSEYFEERPPHW